MASDEFGHTAKQETLDAAPPMRTNGDQIGAPLCSGIAVAAVDGPFSCWVRVGMMLLIR